MTFTPIAFTVHGKPATKGSLKNIARRGAKPVLVESNKGADTFRQKVAWAAKCYAETIPEREPVHCALTVYLPRPALHFRTGTNAGTVKNSARMKRPTSRATGDIDKYSRLILDALQDAKVLRDDSQVVSLSAIKHYMSAQGDGSVIIELTPAGEVTP